MTVLSIQLPLRLNQGANVYEIAERMTWNIRAKSWDAFPPGQKWFAFGETLALVDRLIFEGRISRTTELDGTNTYRTNN